MRTQIGRFFARLISHILCIHYTQLSETHEFNHQMCEIMKPKCQTRLHFYKRSHENIMDRLSCCNFCVEKIISDCTIQKKIKKYIEYKISVGGEMPFRYFEKKTTITTNQIVNPKYTDMQEYLGRS